MRERDLPILSNDAEHSPAGGCCGPEGSRRDFLRRAFTISLGSLTLAVIPALAEEGQDGDAPLRPDAPGGPEPRAAVFGYLIDTDKCMGSGKCLIACRAENDVPEGYHRTWLERYIHFKDGAVRVDMVPEEGLAALEPVDPETVARAYFVPKMCNHCVEAPCNQVCPVHAAFTSPEGVQLVDPDRCIGCAYCVQACPYGARFINPDTGNADKCTWCYHRIKRNEQPACVEACPTGARIFGRLDDPTSEISKRLAKSSSQVLKQYLGTEPQTRYVRLSQEVI